MFKILVIAVNLIGASMAHAVDTPAPMPQVEYNDFDKVDIRSSGRVSEST